MVFPGMPLSEDTAYARPVSPHQDEQVFRNEHLFGEIIDEFNVCEPLLTGTYLVLAFHDIYSPVLQNSESLSPGFKIKIENRIVIFLSCAVWMIVLVV